MRRASFLELELLALLRVPALLRPLPAILFNAIPPPLQALFDSFSGSGAGSTPLKTLTYSCSFLYRFTWKSKS